MQIPAFCNTCGTIFASPFNIQTGTGGGSATFIGNTCGPCPSCGGQGRIPDMTVVGDVIKILSGSQADELSLLRTVLHKAKEKKEEPDVVIQKIRELSPKLANYITSKPKILRNAIIGIILAGITVFKTDININVDLNINQTEIKIINQLNIDADKASKLQPKQEQSKKDVGRNEPCPCGSGKKYKKCCGMI